jgi:hypothetical protein
VLAPARVSVSPSCMHCMYSPQLQPCSCSITVALGRENALPALNVPEVPFKTNKLRAVTAFGAWMGRWGKLVGCRMDFQRFDAIPATNTFST